MRLNTTVLTALIMMFVCLAGCAGEPRQLSAQLVDAAASGDVVEVNRLLNAGAPVDAHARDDWTPLTIASREGQLAVVQLLLKRGASVNLAEGGGHTALFWARKYNHADIENVLLKAGGKNE